MQYLKIITLILVCARLMYWFVKERSANKAIPTALPTNLKSVLIISCTYAYWFLFCAQLLGLDIFKFSYMSIVPIIGFAIYITGELISILGRVDLGTNWSHGAEYQVKPNQSLVTKGTYRYSRHPIYAGFFLVILGGQLLVESYLVIPFTLLCYLVMHIQTLKEERILTAHYGKQYIEYMKHTPRIFPRIF